ncbi:MAG: hypothetical protein AAF570_22385, partial [Bacteroidota bacterium]
MRLLVISFALIFGAWVHAQNLDSLLASPYFHSGIASLDSSGHSFSQNYTVSGSSWLVDSFPESAVFHAEMAYSDASDSTTSYQIRIGKGGHLYSFRSTFGESVPPQWRSSNWT